jgi:hypothetical protein
MEWIGGGGGMASVPMWWRWLEVLTAVVEPTKDGGDDLVWRLKTRRCIDGPLGLNGRW